MKIYKFASFACLLLSLALYISCKDGTKLNTPEGNNTTALPTETVIYTTAEKTNTPHITENNLTPDTTAVNTANTALKDEPGLVLSKKDDFTFSVWWWDAGKALNLKSRGRYLDFLEYNGINEIYFCPGDYSDEKTAEFVKSAKERGISCLWLTGDASWLKEGNSGAAMAVERFLSYQENADDDAKFIGMHLDIEPHQNPDFSEKRAGYMQNLFLVASDTTQKLNKHGYIAEYDIAFWFDGDTVTTPQGEKLFLDALCENADTLCLMSYRDSAGAVISLSSEEINAANKSGCKIVCGVETHSSEGDDVSFMEEGKKYMYGQLTLLQGLLMQKKAGKCGIAVHYLDTWYTLEN